MALRALSFSNQLELSGGRIHPPLTRDHAAQDRSGWLVCFVSFTMLLLISWSAARPGQWTTTVVVLLFLVPWGWIVLRQPSDAIRSVILNWILIVLPVLSILSALWSDFPAISFKGGAQFLVTTIIGIWAGCCIKPRILISALMSALLLLAVLGVLDGSRDFNRFTGEYTLIGVFGSKNYFALCISLLLLTAVTVAFDKYQTLTFRVLGIAGFCLAAPLLIYARSVGALVVCMSTLMISTVLRIACRLPPKARVALLLLTFLFTIFAVAAAMSDLDYGGVLNYLGKDTTLTGRTLLWQHAADAIADRPLLGGGYEAFWQVGNWSAEQLWLYSYVPNKYGYHFHNTFLEVAVDLGLVGLGIFVMLLALTVLRIIARLFASKPAAEQMFAMTLFIFLLLRMPLEVDLFFPFQLSSILLCVVWIYLQSSSPLRRR
jgi:exopolysaccharide production protein ExoQ